MISENLLQRAKGITKLYGRGFFRASYFFPKKTREATWILYTFVRLPDEMVDTQEDRNIAIKDLEKWINDWNNVVLGKHEETVDPILFAAKEIFDEYKIPYEYSLTFLKSMHQDLNISRYDNYEELRSYMYGSASVIGIMMSYIIGFKEGALPHAVSLGEALQLINFLRDCKEDYKERGRIYIPKEDMDRFGVSEINIKDCIVDDKWKALMKFEINRVQELLEHGRKGIELLDNKGKKAVFASVLVYSEIIKKIIEKDYDVFSNRVVVSPFRKSLLLLKSICKINL